MYYILLSNLAYIKIVQVYLQLNNIIILCKFLLRLKEIGFSHFFYLSLQIKYINFSPSLQ